MNQKSNNYFYIFAFYVVLPIALAKVLWSGALFFLDKDALISPKKESFIYHYNINLAKNIITAKQESAAPLQQVATNNRIDDIRLKGTYASQRESFIVIEDNLGTTFLYKNEKYVGYKLIEVYDERAVLEKDGNKYDIVLAEDNGKQDKPGKSTSAKSIEEPETKSEYVPGEPIQITRTEIDSYIKEPNKIWKNIRIQELRKDGQLDGFRVNYVKKGSFFQKAGIKSGDVIKSIEGKEIQSLADVMKYYADIKTLEGLSIGVKRGEEEIDFEFNVN